MKKATIILTGVVLELNQSVCSTLPPNVPEHDLWLRALQSGERVWHLHSQ